MKIDDEIEKLMYTHGVSVPSLQVLNEETRDAMLSARCGCMDQFDDIEALMDDLHNKESRGENMTNRSVTLEEVQAKIPKDIVEKMQDREWLKFYTGYDYEHRSITLENHQTHVDVYQVVQMERMDGTFEMGFVDCDVIIHGTGEESTQCFVVGRFRLKYNGKDLNFTQLMFDWMNERPKLNLYCNTIYNGAIVSISVDSFYDHVVHLDLMFRKRSICA